MADITFCGRVYSGKKAFIKADIVYTQEDVDLLQQQVSAEGKARVKVCESRGGKLYCALDTWKPQQRQERPEKAHRYTEEDRPPSQPQPDAEIDDAIPF